MKLTHATTALAVVAALALAGCGKQIEATPQAPNAAASSSSTPVETPTPSESTSEENFPTPEPSDLAPTTDASSLVEYKFGESGSFSQEDVTFEVTVGKSKTAKCRSLTYGVACTKPQTGDRYVNVPIIVRNTGKSALELTPSLFVIEYADSTRMDSTEGNTYEYGPENTLDYDQKVRPGGTLKTSLTFEAPKGAFSVVMLSSSYGGEDLALWK